MFSLIRWVPGSFPDVKRQGREVKQSPPSSVDVANERSYTSISLTCLHGVGKDNFTVRGLKTLLIARTIIYYLLLSPSLSSLLLSCSCVNSPSSFTRPSSYSSFTLLFLLYVSSACPFIVLHFDAARTELFQTPLYKTQINKFI